MTGLGCDMMRLGSDTMRLGSDMGLFLNGKSPAIEINHKNRMQYKWFVQ